MASAVADLEAGLQAMAGMKPPGVSGSRIASLTTLCVANIQSESVLIQKLYTHFKKAPSTHKLGVLYVVDSVTRKWLEQAKAQGQTVGSSAPDGTFAAGVHRVTELMPVLMNDILSTVPQEQKEKIKKLIDIWEKGATFPQAMVKEWEHKLTASPAPNASTTPPGSPPASAIAAIQNNTAAQLQTQATAAPAAAPAAAAPASILEALANLARQKSTAPPSNAVQPPPASAASYSMPPAAAPQPAPASMPPAQHAMAYPPPSQPVNPSSLPFPMPQVPGPNPAPAAPPSLASLFGAAAGAGPGAAPTPAAPPAGHLDPTAQQQILLVKALADQGVPFDKIPGLLQTLLASTAGAPAAAPPNPYGGAPVNPYGAAQPWQAPAQQSQPAPNPRDRFRDKSPPMYGKRSRSRSPDRGWGGQGSPRGRGYDDRNGRRSDDFRQRSPAGRHNRGNSPGSGFPHVERRIEMDPSLPNGCIRVYSRTLFVGGVTFPESELRAIFNHFGTVQTCIVNRDKRHAFVKMLTRKDAEAAKRGTEQSKDPDFHLRTRWGVGFGPRDCSDYQSGVSVIPIDKLTDADRKWMLTAPYGGSGGRPIESGMVVEEPDIEIGAGVSSKAISRRMQTDKGGHNGPKSTRTRDDDEDSNRWRRGRDGPDHGGRDQQQQQQQQQQPYGGGQGQQGFGFGMGFPSGMPNIPDQNYNYQGASQGGNRW